MKMQKDKKEDEISISDKGIKDTPVDHLRLCPKCTRIMSILREYKDIPYQWKCTFCSGLWMEEKNSPWMSK